MKPSLLIFGGGSLQLSIIKTAKKLGNYTIVIDPDADAPGKEIADIFYVVAGDDFERTLAIAKQHRVNGIVTTATDKPILMMCRIARQLNLPFPSVKSCDILLDKSKFKRFLFENKLPHAKGVLAVGEIQPKMIDLQFPLITKPVKNSGSRGVIKVESPKLLQHAISETIKYTNDNTLIIEEFIEGDEISVEALVQNRIVHIVQITDKIVSPPPYNVEMGHIQPSKYSYLKEGIRALLQTIIQKSGLDNCAIHPEMKISEERLTIIEIGPRLGGDFITSHLVPLSTGLNIEEQLIRIAMGQPIHIQNNNNASLISYLNFPFRSIIKTTINEKQLNLWFPEVKEYNCTLKQGQITNRITNSLDRYGYFILSGASTFQINEVYKSITSLLTKKIIENV